MIIKIKDRQYLGIKISLLLPNQVSSNLSFGMVKNSKTLNYKTFKPEKNGLFCHKVFNEYDLDFEDFKISEEEDDDIKCPDFFNKDIYLNPRKSKLAHYNFFEFFINTLYYKSPPYYISKVLDISQNDIKKILYDNYYIVLASNTSRLKNNEIINFNDYLFYKKKFFKKFSAKTGHDALYHILNNFDYSKELNKLKHCHKFFNNRYKFFKSLKNKDFKRYRILKKFSILNFDLSKFFIKNIFVLPPNLRPIIKLPNDNIVSSDLNELYKRVIDRNTRFKKLVKCSGLPNIVLLNERKNIQNSIDELFLGGGKNINNKPLKSISENLKGKKGFFRQNLLGKRVDYSGRAVIASGPDLKFGECAIPEDIAVELLRPFIYNILLLNKNYNINMAKYNVDKKTNLAKSITKELIKDFYVLLNRAPTLHRLGMQSFRTLLTKDKVIKLHPLVCSAFNADFDGDQMAIHLPISVKSKVECKNLLFSGNNILHPSNGSCCIAPTQDIILGIYYSTKIRGIAAPNYIFNNLFEAIFAYNCKHILINSVIFFRFKEFVEGNYIYKIYKTTLGRILIYNVFPYNYPFFYINKILKKSNISEILDSIVLNFNFRFIYTLSNNLMKIGFNFVTNSGLSICIDDMFFCYNKKNILSNCIKLFISYNIDYLNFLLTINSKKKKILDLWDNACNLISNFIFNDLSFSNYIDYNSLFLKNSSFNCLYIMMDSGARGSESQIKQICSDRGLMTYKKYGFLDLPVLNSLRDGLNVFEYFYFSHNSRKTLADTALKTSSAGYLTRRLVESSNDIFISEYDCNTSEGLIFKNLTYEGVIIEDIFERIFGRVILYLEVKNFLKKDFIFKNVFIDKDVLILLKKINIDTIMIRSPLKCKSKIGICSLCYGLDLSRGKIVTIGEMVGIVAAQAIGEPGTQLTMRTFHTGGVLNRSINLSFFKSNSFGVLKYSNCLKYVYNKDNIKIVISKFSKIKIFSKNNEELEYFNIPYSSYLFFDNNSFVKKGDLICKWDSNYKLVISEYDCFIKFNNFFENLNFINRFDINCREITNYKISPSIDLINSNGNFITNLELSTGNLIFLKDGDFITTGDVLFKTPLSFNITKDIVGGLPKVDAYFEARNPVNSAFIAPIDGIAKIKYLKNKVYLNIINNNNDILFSSLLPKDRNIIIEDNQFIYKGDLIIDGFLNPHDILFTYGLDYLVNFLIVEIKYIYSSQGVKINDKHIEIIIKEMLSNVIITNPGKSNFVIGDVISKKTLNSLKNSGNSFFSTIKYETILLGITKKSLNNNSFLAAASFQRTDSILSISAINSKYDSMSSLKNVVMVGNIFVAGTGSYEKILINNKKNDNIESDYFEKEQD